MSSKDLMVDGKLLSSLRVVDLKEALEKRGLSKSGTKKDLADRLKQYVLLENERNSAVPVDEEQLPNFSTREQLAEQNPFLRDYFQSQAELFHSQKVVKKLYEGMTHTPEEVESSKAPAMEGNIITAEPVPTENDEGTAAAVNVNNDSKVGNEKSVVIEEVEEVSSVTIAEKVQNEEDVTVTPAPELPFVDSMQESRTEAAVVNVPLNVADEEKSTSISPAEESPKAVEPAAPEPCVRESTPEPVVREPTPEPVAREPTPEPVVREPTPKPVVREPTPEPVVREPTPEPVVRERTPVESIETEAVESSVDAIKESEAVDISKVEDGKAKATSPEEKAGTVFDVLEKDHVTENHKAEKAITEVSPAKDVVLATKNDISKKDVAVDEVRQEEQADDGDSKSVDESSQSSETSESSAEDEAVSRKVGKKVIKSSTDITPEESLIPAVGVEAEPMETSVGPPSSTHDTLDYDEEEADDDTRSGEHDGSTWKRQGKTGRYKSPIRTVTAAETSSNEENTPTEKPQPNTQAVKKSPADNLRRTSSNVAMDVDEVLDYGDDEGEVKRELEEFTWSRRILRLKNRCTIAEKTERKWTRTDRKPVLVTSEVLETFFPDVKPLPESEIRFEEKPVKEKETSNVSEAAVVDNSEAQISDVSLPSIRRKISIIPFDEPMKELTPPRHAVTNVLIITNLTRPFTLMQLKELLQRTGGVEDIWVDKIKSKCLAKFESEAEAEETRAALHGIKWPQSNPKALIVDYSSREEFDDLRGNDIEERIRVEQPKEAKNLPVREWDLGKRSRSRSPGRTRRSISGDRKRVRRSASPTNRRSPHQDKKPRDSDLKDEAQVKALDELFRKTSTTPCLYWLPLTPEQISEKEELRRKRMIERERRIAEMEKLRPR